MPQLFTHPEAWAGGFYELSIELKPSPDERLPHIIQAIWNHPNIAGCWLERDKETDQQPRLNPNIDLLADAFHIYGLATLSDGCIVPCGTISSRDTGGSDWAILYIPLGALHFGTSGYPFMDDGFEALEIWRSPLESWFAEIGTDIYKQVAFQLALIGFEPENSHNAEQVANFGIPMEREIGYLWAENNQLQYFPRTQSI